MKNSVKYSWSIHLSRLTLTGKTEVRNLGLSTPDLVIFQLSTSRIQKYVFKFNPAMYAEPPAEVVGSNPTGGMDVCLL